MEGKRPCNKKLPRRGGSSFHLEASRDSRLPRMGEGFKAEQAVLWGLEDRNEHFAKQKSLYQEGGVGMTLESYCPKSQMVRRRFGVGGCRRLDSPIQEISSLPNADPSQGHA